MQIRSVSFLFVAFVAALGLPASAQAGAVIGTNFTGSTFGVDSGFIPPDSMGATGPSHVVEMINGRYAVYDKSGAVSTSSSLNAFWTAAGATPSGSFAFDPRVLYDPSSGRWYATSVDNAGAANNFLFAVSASSDPTGSWTGFKLDSDPTDTNWADFPTMGYDSGAVYVAANMFPLAAGTTQVSILVLPKADLLAGSVANMTAFYNEDLGAPDFRGFAVQPVVNLDGGGMPTPLIAEYATAAGFYATSTISGTPLAPVLGTGVLVAKPAYGSPGDADQMGSATDIETNDARISGNAVLANGNVWTTQTVDVAGKAAIAWQVFDSTGTTLLNSGVISDAVMEYFYPSVAVNPFGDVVIGFSGSGPNDYVGSYASVGTFLAGSAMFEDPMLLMAGLAPYVRNDGAGRNRWGDYSATVLDPTDPYRFWTFQEYASATNTWSVQITELIITQIPEPGTAPLMGLGLFVIGFVVWRRRRTSRPVRA